MIRLKNHDFGHFFIYVEQRRRQGGNVEQRRRRCVQHFVAAKTVHAFTNATLSFRTRFIDGNTYVAKQLEISLT